MTTGNGPQDHGTTGLRNAGNREAAGDKETRGLGDKGTRDPELRDR